LKEKRRGEGGRESARLRSIQRIWGKVGRGKPNGAELHALPHQKRRKVKREQSAEPADQWAREKKGNSGRALEESPPKELRKGRKEKNIRPAACARNEKKGKKGGCWPEMTPKGRESEPAPIRHKERRRRKGKEKRQTLSAIKEGKNKHQYLNMGACPEACGGREGFKGKSPAQEETPRALLSRRRRGRRCRSAAS